MINMVAYAQRRVEVVCLQSIASGLREVSIGVESVEGVHAAPQAGFIGVERLPIGHSIHTIWDAKLDDLRAELLRGGGIFPLARGDRIFPRLPACVQLAHDGRVWDNARQIAAHNGQDHHMVACAHKLGDCAATAKDGVVKMRGQKTWCSIELIHLL